MRDQKNLKKFLKKLSFDRNSFKPQYKKYYDEVKSLFLNGKIIKSQAEKIFIKLTSRGNAAKSGIELINKFNIKTTTKKVEKPLVEKKYDVVAHVVVRTIWYKDDAKSVIIDQEADVLTSLYYRNHYNKKYFDENKSPDVYTLVNFPIPATMKKRIKYIHIMLNQLMKLVNKLEKI